MSLQITSTLETPQGEVLTNAYGRVAVINPIDGNRLEAVVSIFKDLAAFESGKNEFFFPNINTAATAPYVYGPGTENILDIAHDLLIQSLGEQGVVAVKELAE